MANLINPMLEPKYAYGPAPNYTKCDASTGPTPGPSPPCAVKAYGQCGGTRGCCAGSCTCTGTGTYKQCDPPKGQYKC